MTKPHVRIENDLFQAIMICDFSKRQLKIIYLIYRLSVGCQREWAIIPQKKDFEAVGVTQNHIKHEIGWLMNTRVILNNGNLYRINPNFNDWAISPVNTYEPTQINELLKLNLSTSQNGKSELPKTGSEEDQTSQNGKSELPKTGSEEDQTSQNGKSKLPFSGSVADTNLATAIDNVQTMCVFNISSIQHTQLTDLYKKLHGLITPQIILDIRAYAEKYGFEEVKFAITESGKNGGKSSNYLLRILENRARDRGADPPGNSSKLTSDINARIKQIPPPPLPPLGVWDLVKGLIKPQITRTNFESYFSHCAAVRWDGCCLILKAPPGVDSESYRQKASMIRNALIKILNSDDVDFEFEREVEHAIKT